MPTYMDVHEGMHVTPQQLAEAHQKDVEAQKGTGVEYVRYWLDSKAGKVFCLAKGPNKEDRSQRGWPQSPLFRWKPFSGPRWPTLAGSGWGRRRRW